MTGFGFLLQRRVARLAIFAVALVHLGIAVAPHTDRNSDASATRPHLHAVGDTLELPHAEAACPTCSGLHLATQPTVTLRIAVAPATAFVLPATRELTLESAAQYRTVLSRAPPATV